jgi:hypothetical protein
MAVNIELVMQAISDKEQSFSNKVRLLMCNPQIYPGCNNLTSQACTSLIKHAPVTLQMLDLCISFFHHS